MTPSRIVVLVGAVLLVALGAIYVADHNRTSARIDRADARAASANTYGDYSVYSTEHDGSCFNNQTQTYVSRHLCAIARAITAGPRMRDSWQRRKGWYEYSAAAVVVLTLATAFALSRRRPSTGAPAS